MNLPVLAGGGLLLAAFVALVAFTPALVFGEPAFEETGAILGHAGPHEDPVLACTTTPSATERYHLLAAETEWEVAPGGPITAWAFNGTLPGPALCADAGDTLVVTVENRLAVPLRFHTHLPEIGTPGDVAPGATGTFTFAATTPGTFVYHDLANGNEGAGRGLAGVLIVRDPANPVRVDHEVVLAVGEVQPALFEDTYAATVNGRGFPLMPHLQFAEGERVLVHLVNLGPGEEHTLHVHGHRWFDPGDGRVIDNKFLSPHTAVAHGDLPQYEGVVPMTHALAPDAATFLLRADEPGMWMYHCHVYDHINAGMTGMMTVLRPGEEGHHHG